MTSAQIVQHLQPGGIEALALTLMEQQQDSIIISLEGAPQQAITQWPRLAPFRDRIFFLGKPDGFSIGTIKQLKELLRSHKVSAIHTHHIGPFLYGGIAAALNGIKKHVHTEHDGWHLQNAKHSSIQRCLNVLLQPTLVADAKQVAHAIKTSTGAKSQIIYNGIDTEKFRPCENEISKYTLRLHWGLENTPYLLGSAGRLETVKGHEYLIRALQHLPDTISLALAGSGSCEHALKKLATSLNLQHRVHFLGHIDNTENFYRMLDAFCLPSLNEGFPLAPLEAQACNIPSIVTAVGGAGETLCPLSGIAVEPANPLALADAILKQSKTPKHASPRPFICQHFSIDAMTNAYQQLLSA